MNTTAEQADAAQSSSLFSIGAEGVDAGAIVAEIQATVARKLQSGQYRDARIARAERTNLVHLRDEESFMAFYLDCLRESVFVDINDFTIQERRQRLGGVMVALKTLIWKILKFYTYRLWSQQNQVNGLLLTAMEGVDEKYRHRLRDLEARLAELEKRQAGPGKSV